MITKLLFTAGIIFLVFVLVRTRARRDAFPAASPNAKAVSTGVGRQVPRLAAYGLLVLALIGTGLILYLEWSDQYRVVTVKIINTHTGDSTTYLARRGDVAGRQFETIEGRIVTLADVERMELTSGE